MNCDSFSGFEGFITEFVHLKEEADVCCGIKHLSENVGNVWDLTDFIQQQAIIIRHTDLLQTFFFILLAGELCSGAKYIYGGKNTLHVVFHSINVGFCFYKLKIKYMLAPS